ncbi:glycosyltransferase family 2 protein [Chryseobacterium sp. MDT2-18]|uniref:glycosyltransferase family 2 protein n=1 Tax=Chryseobacterium sp. MDT2-18 TaxID=1259136 RepID=UPI002785955F|nr:glycosyltransferase family 2 protein [Chryseobacterium sp. MDT2-18]MDQ0478179.1 glycosyltransferase involved in cell wall biosynthesis [Chryseobacterium sp. MDT2-18]
MTDCPKVSIVTITYGHENYITQTLDGVLMQQYAGEIEFVIANDHSPDATDCVIKDYLSVKKIPTNFTIKYTRHEKNKGMMPNFIWALEQASGKYIALCEGDDYWSDPLKLQKQVGFLEDNEGFVLCFTRQNILEEAHMKISETEYKKNIFNKSEIPFIHVPTLTTVFRNVTNLMPRQMYRSIIDASLFLYLSQFGKFYRFEEETAVYRVHTGGIYSGSSEIHNLKRSVAARLAAWRYLKNIDKVATAENIVFLLRLKMQAEQKENMRFAVLKTKMIERFFIFYLMQDYLKKKWFLNANPQDGLTATEDLNN